MANEQKSSKVIGLIDDLYGDAGMAVVNLMMDYMSDENWGNLYDKLKRDGEFQEDTEE